MKSRTMKSRIGAFSLSVLCSMLLVTGALAADSAGEPDRSAGG